MLKIKYFTTLFSVVILFLILMITGCEPFATQFEDVEPGDIYHAANMNTPPSSADSIKVMTWNIRFGAGRVLCSVTPAVTE